MKSQFAIQSLFEGTAYITVYDRATGEPAGRITIEPDQTKPYLAITEAASARFSTEAEARGFIYNPITTPGLFFTGEIIQKVVPVAKQFQIVLSNDHGQRKVLSTLDGSYTKNGAERMATTYRYSYEGYKVTAVPIY